mgnify:FL=1
MAGRGSKKRVTRLVNEIRKAGWTSAASFCKDWGIKYSLLHNWMSGTVRNASTERSSREINLLCDIFQCTPQYIDQLCEDAYQIAEGMKPEHALAPLGDKEATINRVLSDDKEENTMEIPLEQFLQQAAEPEIESHVEPIDEEKDNYIRSEMAKEEAHTRSMKLTLSEYDEIEEAVYGKLPYLKFKRLMNCIKYYCM